MTIVITPRRIESSPRVGPIVVSSATRTATGSAPARSAIARIRASS